MGGKTENYAIVISSSNKDARKFLDVVGEISSRGEFMDVYKLTPFSLMTCASYEITADSIIKELIKISSNPIDQSVIDYIVQHVNIERRVYVEYGIKIKKRKLLNENGDESEIEFKRDANDFFEQVKCIHLKFTTLKTRMEAWAIENVRMSSIGVISSDSLMFEIEPKNLPEIKKDLMECGIQPIEQYDYENDIVTPSIPCELALPKGVEIRPYQSNAIKRIMFKDRARSGVIVLPCGAGKTLTGIMAACRIGKSTLILCNNNLACAQWIDQWKRYVKTEDPTILTLFTGDETPDEKILLNTNRAIILATTYNILSMSDERRRAESISIIQAIRSRTWGVALLDEVHIVPAKSFRDTLSGLTCMVKIGLTATLVREDEQQDDINFIVGPKIYEADWQSLTQDGYIARVECMQVLCPFSIVFAREYWPTSPDAVARGNPLLYEMNPNKLELARIIMEYHEKRGDRVLIMADRVEEVETFGKRYKRKFMHGGVSSYERDILLREFRNGMKNGGIQTLIMSRVGDVAIDVPDANVLIQIGALGASRRQETQRVGRVMRAKENNHAYFYTLVTNDTPEAHFCSLRFSYLADLGYAYRSIPWKKISRTDGDLHDEETQRKFLNEIVSKLAK